MALGLAGSGIITGFDSASDGFGRVLQVVRATDTTNRSTTSTSFVDVTGMSVTITPQKSTSAILIVASFLALIESNSSSTVSAFQITDSSNNAISGSQSNNFQVRANNATPNRLESPLLMTAYATPATTSATTYKLRFRDALAAATVTVKNADNTGEMYAIEVAA